jgi:hypothetical protein
MPSRWAGVRVGQKPSRLALLLAIVGEVEHAALPQVGHDRQYRCRLAMAFSSTPSRATTSAPRRGRPRLTARALMPPPSSQLMCNKAVLNLLAGRVSDRIGRKPILVAG